MKLALNQATNRIVKKCVFEVKKYAPEILISLGIVGAATSTVLACKGTIEAQEIMKEAKEIKSDIDECSKHIGDEDYKYDEKTHREDLVKFYYQTGSKLAKIYAPSVAIGAASIGCIIFSHSIMKNRLGTVLAAYTALDNYFRQYRKRIQEKFGTNKELEAYHGVKELKGSFEDGDDVILKAKNDDKLSKIDGYSIYARCFDEYNENWKDNPEYNLDFLRGVLRYLNSKLVRDRFVTLNEAYAELGFKPTQAGQIVGWTYEPDRKDGGDNCISFGLYNTDHCPALGDFINGNTSAVFLDFNVDGVIIDKIPSI